MFTGTGRPEKPCCFARLARSYAFSHIHLQPTSLVLTVLGLIAMLCAPVRAQNYLTEVGTPPHSLKVQQRYRMPHPLEKRPVSLSLRISEAAHRFCA
jgi:hypothetical protein